MEGGHFTVSDFCALLSLNYDFWKNLTQHLLTITLPVYFHAPFHKGGLSCETANTKAKQAFFGNNVNKEAQGT